MVAEATMEMLRETGHRIKTRDLARMLREKGITFGTGDPERLTADLSAALTRYTDRLNSSRKEGWGLTEWGNVPSDEGEPDVDDDLPTDTSIGEPAAQAA